MGWARVSKLDANRKGLCKDIECAAAMSHSAY
jgi:hypothetical protein